MAGKKKGKKDDKVKNEKKLKQEAKAAKKAKKMGGEEDDQDLEAIIREMQEKDKAKEAPAQIVECEPPSPRSNASLVLAPSGELFLYGGELFDGANNTCFKDLYRYNPVKAQWRSVVGSVAPPARCSHATCLVSKRNHMYVFGGEFATAWQFHHYRDLWRFDLERNIWEALDTPTGPSPRSGHRMVVWKHFLVLFGGFYEASRGTKWFNDLWVFDLRTLKWNQIQLPSRSQQPSPRSGFVFAAHPTQDMIYLYGGYAKVSVSVVAQRGRRFEDMWRLNLAMKGDNPWPVAKWDAVPVKGKAPVQRSGVSVSVHRNRIVVFGGVTDNETKNDVLGQFHNSMFTFDMDRARWFALDLRKKKSGAGAGRRKRRGGGDDTSTTFTGHDSQAYDAFEDNDDDDSDSDSGNVNDDGMDDNAFYYIIDGKMVKVEAEEDEDEAAVDNVDADGEKEVVATSTDGDVAMVDEQVGAGVDAVAVGVSEVKIDGAPALTDNQTPPVAGQVAAALALCAPGRAETGETVRGGEETKQSQGGADTVDTTMDVSGLGASEEEKAKQAIALEPVEVAPAPEPRMGAHTTVANNKLYVYGGATERGNKQVTFDDMWVLDLNQLEKWENVEVGTWTSLEWAGEEQSQDDEDEEEEEESDSEEEESDEEDDDDDEDGAGASAAQDEDDMKVGTGRDRRQRKLRTSRKIEELKSKLNVGEEHFTPLPGESLRAFFVRSWEYWLQEVIMVLTRKANNRGEEYIAGSKGKSHGDTKVSASSMLQGKELRRLAFTRAEKRFEELFPLLQQLNELEEEQRLAEQLAQEYAKSQTKAKAQGGAGGKRKKGGK